MKILWTLIWHYLREVGLALVAGSGKNPTKGFRWGPLGIGLLSLLGVGGLAYLSFTIFYGLCEALAPYGRLSDGLMAAYLGAFLFSLILGFMSVLGTLAFAPAQDLLLSLPIPPWKLLLSRWVSVYLQVLGLSLVLTWGALAGAWAFGEHSFDRFLSLILGLLTIPLGASILAFLAALSLINLGGIFRNRDFTLVVLGILGIILGIGLQIPLNQFLQILGDPRGVVSWTGTWGAFFQDLGQALPPLDWLAQGHWLGSLGTWGLILGLGVLFLVFFQGSFLKALKNSGGRGPGRPRKNKFEAQKNQLISWILRDFKLLVREPLHLINGPMILFLLPLVIGVMMGFNGALVSAQLDNLQGLPPQIQDLLYLSLGAAGIFLGGSTSVLATGFSREGKVLFSLKALPTDFEILAWAKYLHGMAYSIIVVPMVGTLLFLAQVPLGFSLLILAALGVLVSTLNLWMLILDARFPRLHWDNPLAAMKQNPNALAGIGSALGVVALWILPCSPLVGLPAIPWTMILIVLGLLGFWWGAFRILPKTVKRLAVSQS